MNLIILQDSDKISNNKYLLTDYRFDHINNILQSTEGDTLEAGLLNGPKGTATIESITDTSVTLQCLLHHHPPHHPPRQPIIDLICALPRPQILKKVLYTASLMNIRNLHLVRADKVKKMYYSASILQPENYNKYLFDGLSQGRNTQLPQLFIHNRFRIFFEDTFTELESAEPTPAKLLLPDMHSENHIAQTGCNCFERIVLAIGPEGGWVPFELDLMTALGFQKFNIGPWTLRVEHAVIAAIAQIQIAAQKQELKQLQKKNL